MSPALRRPLIAGNWKMNGLQRDGTALAQRLRIHSESQEDVSCELLLCPPATLLPPIAAILKGSRIALGAQDCHRETKGAFTGDIAASMLADVGCSYVILGHSERRQAHGETDAQVAAKVRAAWAAGLTAILCVGETTAQRNEGKALDVVQRQIRDGLPSGATPSNVVITYEPIWAVGTGQVASLDIITNMHTAIRGILAEGAGSLSGAGAEQVRILYGGSVKPENAAAILALSDVDGTLVGGASLDADAFWAIACSCR